MLKKFSAKSIVSVLSSLIFAFTMIVGVFPIDSSAYTYYTLKYEAGDYDGLVGSTEISYQRISGVSFDVASSSRFSRKGYKLTSWYIPSTGETVSPSSQYTMPENDITFIANWTPENYTLTFAGNGGKTDADESNIYVDATCGDVINLPENPFTKSGYTFSGWTYDNVTYDAGAEFTVPGVLSGSKIVFAAEWIKATAVTTVATTAATTTTTTTTTVQTTVSSTLGEGMNVTDYTINKQLDNSDNNTYKIYLYKLIKSDYTVEKVEFNFSADCENIGQVSIAIGTTLKDGNWYQKDFSEIIRGNTFTIDFGDTETCNNLKYSSSFQIGYWYGETIPLNLDSIRIIYTQPEVTTTTSATTTTPVATTTTTTVSETEETMSFATTATVSDTAISTEATTSETTTESVTSASETTTVTTTVSTTPAVTLKPSQYSKVVDVNSQINMGGILEIPGSELIAPNQIVESMEITISANGNAIENYNMAFFTNTENGIYFQKDAVNYTTDDTIVVQIELDENTQQGFTKNTPLNMGYWWGSNSELTVESIKVNYRIDKGDYNSDGIVDSTDAETLKKYMVGISVDGTEINMENADINNDGQINVFDYMELTRKL